MLGASHRKKRERQNQRKKATEIDKKKETNGKEIFK